jgi:hypothetical protein
MLMVVFGAGASADSVNPDVLPVARGRMPPTAAQLFGYRESFDKILRTNYPMAVSAVQHLRERIAKGNSMEVELARLQDEAEDYEADRRALVAIRFYIQEVIREGDRFVSAQELTNYRSLVRTLDKWRHTRGEPVVYLTFNYDAILEPALESALDIPRFGSLGAYHASDRFQLFKLHGSVDWWHPTAKLSTPRDQRDMRVGFINEVRMEDIHTETYELRDPDRFYSDPVEGMMRLYFPAIAIPVEKKSHFECPSDHVERLKGLLPRVDKVLTVGWRAQEAHFLDLMAEHLPAQVETLVVTSAHNSAVEVYKRLRDHFKDRPRNRVWHEHLDHEWAEGFSGLVTSNALRSFLMRSSGASDGST